MNIRLSILLVSLLLLFGGTFLVVRLTASSDRDPDEPWLYRMSEDTMSHIEITHGGKTVNYDKKPGSIRWVIQGDPDDPDDPDIPVFLDKWSGTPLLLSGPRVNRALADTIEDPAAYGLDPPLSVIKVTDRDGQSFEFHMGITTPDENNQYARLAGHPQLFSVPEIWGRVINRLATEPPYLRLFQAEVDELVYIEVTDKEETVAYGQKNDRLWYIVDDNSELPTDPDRWGDTPTFLSGPRVSQILLDELENPAQYGLEPPETSVRLGFRAGAETHFYLGSLTPDGEHRYARVVDEPELYAMPLARAKLIEDLVANPPYATEQATPGPG